MIRFEDDAPSIWFWTPPRDGEVVPDHPPVDMTQYIVPGSGRFTAPEAGIYEFRSMPIRIPVIDLDMTPLNEAKLQAALAFAEFGQVYVARPDRARRAARLRRMHTAYSRRRR